MNKIKIILMALCSFIFSEQSFAEFSTGVACNNCNSVQYKTIAKTKARTGQIGNVYVFDFGNHNFKKFYVERESSDGINFTIAFELQINQDEMDLFNDLDAVAEAASIGNFGIDAPGSAYDYIGCSACERSLGLWLTDNHTWSVFWREALSQSTSVFKFNADGLNFGFDYTIEITFDDGSTFNMNMVNGEFMADQNTYRDSDGNVIPRNAGDLNGSTYQFSNGSGGSNHSNFIDRIALWGISSSGGGAALSCTFTCDRFGNCTLTCKRL